MTTLKDATAILFPDGPLFKEKTQRDPGRVGFIGKLGLVNMDPLGTKCRECDIDILVGGAWTRDLCYTCGHAIFLILNNMR